MATIPVSVRMDESIKSRLDNEASLQDRSIGYLVEKAVEEFLDHKEFFRSEMKAAIAEADKGIFISEEAMDRWMESWGTQNELPPPEPVIFPDKP